MKKTFLVRRNALLSSANLSWGALALVFALCCLVIRVFAPNFFLQAFAPAFRVSETITAASHSFFTSFSDAAAVAARNEQLANENAMLASENNALEQKVAGITAFLGASGISKPAAGVLAGVVSRPPESPYDTIIVAAGGNAGVTTGLEAFGGTVPLGVVTSVTADFSRITLFSAPGMVTRGWVGGASLPVDVYGTGAGTFQASLSRLANVSVGDTVFAPGPGMLPIGVVARIDSDPSATTITLRIVPRINPFSLTWIALRDTGAAFRSSFTIASSTPL